MKSFLEHLNEEVLPTAQVADGSLDIDKPAVRAAINAALAGVTSQPAVTPYVVFNRLSKLLAQYHIILPKRFLEGDKGVEVFELRQFGHKMGMTDSGEFVSEVPTTHYLFLQYGIITPFGVTYAKPVVGGMFRVMARLVDKAELDKLIDMAEITMAEEAECMQAIAKANAPKEPMHDVTSDPKKVGNKKAVNTSEKKSLDEERKRTENVSKAFLEKRPANQRTLKSHGDSVTYHGNTIAKHIGDEVHVTTAGHALSPSTRGHINGILTRLGSPTLSVRKGQLHHGDTPVDHDAWIKVKKPSVSEEKNDLKGACWKGYTAKGLKKKGGRMVPNCVPVEEETVEEGRMPASVIKHKEKIRQMSDDQKKEYFKGKTHEQLQSMAWRHGYGKGSDVYSKHVTKKEQIDELKRSTLASYIKKAHVSGLEAASQGEIAYANKDKAGLRAANKTGEKREQGIERAASKLAKEETIAEKAPPGAKFERMVKHIKKGYAEKDGLSKKEKSIAYATAWKAKNREKGE